MTKVFEIQLSFLRGDSAETLPGRPQALSDSSIVFCRKLHSTGIGYGEIQQRLPERLVDTSRYSVRRAALRRPPYDYEPSTDSG